MYINQSITGLGHCIHTTVFPVTVTGGTVTGRTYSCKCYKNYWMIPAVVKTKEWYSTNLYKSFINNEEVYFSNMYIHFIYVTGRTCTKNTRPYQVTRYNFLAVIITLYCKLVIHLVHRWLQTVLRDCLSQQLRGPLIISTFM